MFKQFIIILAVILACQTPVMADELSDLIAVARDNNPRILQALNKWKAAEHSAKASGVLDDPMFTYGYFGEEVQTRVGPQEQKFGVSQKIPFPGKLRLKSSIKNRQADILQEQYRAVESEVIKELKVAYYDLYWIDRAIDINLEEKEILEKLEKVAQRRYESNLAPQQDVIKTQVELSRILQKIIELKQTRQSVAVKINTLLDRSVDTSISEITSIDQTPFLQDVEQVRDDAFQNRQELAAAMLNVESSKKEKTLSKMAYLPDFNVGVEFIEIGGGTTTRSDDGEDAWVAMFSVNFPLWFSKKDHEIKEKEFQLKAAEQGFQNMKSTVNYEVTDIHLKIKTYKDIVLLYETALIPQARQAFESSQKGFETGSISFIDWLDTHRTYLQTRLAYHKAVSDYEKSLALLERYSGRMIERSSK